MRMYWLIPGQRTQEVPRSQDPDDRPTCCALRIERLAGSLWTTVPPFYFRARQDGTCSLRQSGRGVFLVRTARLKLKEPQLPRGMQQKT